MSSTFWIIAAVVVVALAALAWSSSGRQQHGVDADRARKSMARSQSDAITKSGRPDRFGPGSAGPFG